MIRLCHPCKPGPTAAWQDRTYGRGQRVHNRTKQNKPQSEQGWRCTVCGVEKK